MRKMRNSKRGGFGWNPMDWFKPKTDCPPKESTQQQQQTYDPSYQPTTSPISSYTGIDGGRRTRNRNRIRRTRRRSSVRQRR